MKTKTFDCVQMKDEIQQRRARELAGLSREELIAYYRRIGEGFRKRQQELRESRGEDIKTATNR